MSDDARSITTRPYGVTKQQCVVLSARLSAPRVLIGGAAVAALMAVALAWSGAELAVIARVSATWGGITIGVFALALLLRILLVITPAKNRAYWTTRITATLSPTCMILDRTNGNHSELQLNTITRAQLRVGWLRLNIGSLVVVEVPASAFASTQDFRDAVGMMVAANVPGAARIQATLARRAA